MVMALTIASPTEKATLAAEPCVACVLRSGGYGEGHDGISFCALFSCRSGAACPAYCVEFLPGGHRNAILAHPPRAPERLVNTKGTVSGSLP